MLRYGFQDGRLAAVCLRASFEPEFLRLALEEFRKLAGENPTCEDEHFKVRGQHDGQHYFNGIDQSALVRLKSDGSMDAGFQAVLTGTGDIVPCWGVSTTTVASLAIQEDGKILIAGYFLNVNGVQRHQFARLNSDGSVDGGFQCELSWHDPCLNDRHVLSIVSQPDGRILIGGRFVRVNGVERSGLARLNSDGSLDGSLRAVAYGPFRTEGFVPMAVTSLILQDDGMLLIGGYLGMINEVPVNGIAQLWGDTVMPAEMHSGRMTVTIPVDSGRRFLRVIGEN